MTVRRIARVITRLNIGGPSIQAITLSDELKPSGFDTYLVHGRLDAGEGDMTTILPIGGTAALHLDSLVRPISPAHDLRALWQLYRALRRWRPDIIHTHMAKAGALGRLAGVLYNRTAGRRRPARLVHTYHGHVFEGYFGSASARVFLFIERWLGRRSDALIAISPQIRRDILETYRIGRPEIVRLIPLGFNLDRFASIDTSDRVEARRSLGIPSDAIVLTTVGRLTAIKQHDLFLDVAARLAADPRLQILIVGDGDLRQTLEARSVEHGLAARCRFLGWRGDLERVYGATDVFVLTSRNEGTPVALIEAMAAGVASVSTSVGGVVDVITGPEVGLLAPFGDVEALAAAVRRLFADRDARVRMGAAARSSVLERFHIRRLTQDLSELYRQLITD